MNKRIIILTVLVVASIGLAGCAQNTSSGEDLADDTGANISGVEVGESYAYEVKITEKNQIGLVKEQPPFTLEHSLERENLIRRYKYLNNENNQHHVYLLSNDGKVISYYVAQGKVSSVNSKLTNGKQIVGSNACLDITHSDSEGGCFKTVESPQIDGSYGTNGDAIFFFTTEGAYVEWNGKYLVSERPQGIQTAISIENEYTMNESEA